MANFATALGNAGRILGSGAQTYDNILEQRRQRDLQAFQLAQMQQQAQRQQTQDTQSRQLFDLQMKGAARQADAARGAWGAISGGQPGAQGGGAPPQQVPMPGATPMPNMGQPPAPPPPPPGMGSAPGGPTAPGPQGAPPQAGGQSGGGLTLAQLAQNIDQKLGPDADPQTKLEALTQAQHLLAPGEQAELKKIQLETQRMIAEARVGALDHRGDGAAMTSRRQLDMEALKLGIDPTGKKDDELTKTIAAATGSANKAKADKAAKPTVAEWKYTTATNDVKSTAANIKAIISAHPKAIGAYGKIYKGIGAAYGFLEQPAPEDAEAAQALNAQFEKLNQSLGVAGSMGGQGGSTLTKRWDSVLGNSSIFTNPQKMQAELDSITGDLDRFKAPAGAVQEHDPAEIDSLISKYGGTAP